MKATLTFDLPEEAQDHKYALAGTDALIVISDILSEIRSALRYESGELKDCDADTLEKVSDLIYRLKQDRQLPELY